MEPVDDRRVLARIVRQKLESLGRAGIDRLPLTNLVQATITSPIPAETSEPPAHRPLQVQPDPIPTTPKSLPTSRPVSPPAMVGSLFEAPGLTEIIPAGETSRTS